MAGLEVFGGAVRKPGSDETRQETFSRAGAATVKMVSYTPIIPGVHNPTACYPGEFLPEGLY